MSRKLIHTSEVNVLKHLIDGPGLLTVVYDPAGALVKDDDSVYLCVKNTQELLAVSLQKADKKLCVLNLTADTIAVKGIDYIVEFNAHHDYAGMKKKSWQYINNPSGTIRWLYPAHISKPWFLAFYNFNYWKAACYKLATKLAFLFRLTRLLSNGELAVYAAEQPLFITSLVNSNNNTLKSNYAVFTGTAGPNRKLVIADAGSGRITHFFKIALNEQSGLNVRNEYNALKQLEQMAPANIDFPKAEDINRQTICVSNIKPAVFTETAGWDKLHTRFLDSLYETGVENTSFTDLSVVNDIKQRLQRIAGQTGLHKTVLANDIYDLLQHLMTQLTEENPVVRTSFSHGDFTRWNCYQSKDILHVYDWEMSKPDMPLLFDFFHFVVQGSIFSTNAPVPEMRAQLSTLLAEKSVQQLTHKYAIDSKLYFQLYLLINCSYYLEVYLEQQVLHREAGWLFKAWHELLLEETAVAGKLSLRKQFIQVFFKNIESEKYTVLKNAGKPVSSLSDDSDIDILVTPVLKTKIICWTRSFNGLQKIKLTRKSFMTTMELFFNDASYLSIDLLQAFHRKSITYIDAELMLNNAVTKDRVSMLPPAYDYLYIYLFYQLNYAAVPEKYSRHFAALDSETASAVLEVLQRETGIAAVSIAETFAYNPGNRNAVFQFLEKRRTNSLPARAFRWLQYKRNTLADMLHNKGFMLTFSGVDGAGKSTILNEVKEMLQKKYRKKVVVIRHRPSMLPILSAWKYGKEEAEKKCVESLPRQGKNKSLLSSVGRFSYYYFDYLLGQLVVYCRYTLRGYIVLYDRYYFDFIVDGRRSNISINKSFIKNLYLFVYKPQLNIFLYASPEVILKRKKELSAIDITQLTNDYTRLFSRLGQSNQYMCIENIDKGKTMNTIEQAIIQLN